MTRKKIELILVAFAVIALLADFVLLVPFGGLLVVIALGCLSLFYFTSGLNVFSSRPSKGEEATSSDIGFKVENVAGLVFSVVMIGLLFNIQNWPMEAQYLNFGLAGIGLLLVLIGLKYLRTKTYDAYLLKQGLIYGCLLVILMVLPPFTLINIKYRSYPAYREALKRSIQNPTDTGLRAKVMHEAKKLNN